MCLRKTNTGMNKVLNTAPCSKRTQKLVLPKLGEKSRLVSNKIIRLKFESDGQ